MVPDSASANALRAFGPAEVGDCFFTRVRLQAHVVGRVAPIAVAGAAADHAGLDLIHRSGGEVIQRHGAAVGVQAATLPWAECAAGGDYGKAQFNAFGVFHRADAHE